MTRQAANYRSVAGSVRVYLLDTRLNDGHPKLPADNYAKRRLETIKELLEVGRQFSRNADGSLDQIQSATPEKLTLARELTKLVPGELPEYAGEPDMKAWTRQAVSIIEAISRDDWDSVKPSDIEFLEVELEGFLERLLSLPRETPRERAGSTRF